MWQCHYCRSPLSSEVQRKNRLCPDCNSDIHACRNCVHFDENLGSKCNEPDSPWIRDRSAQNTCTYFEFKKTQHGATPVSGNHDRASEAELAKKAFRALFRTS